MPEARSVCEGVTRLCATGDLLLHGRYDEMAALGQADRVFQGIHGVLAESEIVVGNMECVLGTGGAPREDKLCLKGDPRYAGALRAAGFRILSAANNHMFDFGREGWEETAACLEHEGLRVLGAGKDEAEARRPVLLNVRGIRFGFLAYSHECTKGFCWAGANSPGVALLTRDVVLTDVRRLATEVDHVILLLHWGLEYSPFPTPEQVQLAHNAIDAGASLLIGHHSHMLQGIELYKGGVIAYSLGNLTDSDVDWQGPTRSFSSSVHEVDRETIIFQCEFSKHDVRILEAVPVWLDDDGIPRLASADRAATIRQKLTERSSKLAPDDLKAYWEHLVISRRVGGAFRKWWRSSTPWEKVRRFRLSQFSVLWGLIALIVRTKLSNSESRWETFTSRNDTKPMPDCGEEEADQ